MPHTEASWPRIAYFSPLPPTRSGISDYSRELLPALASLASVTLFVDDPHAVLPEMKSQYEIRPFSEYPTSYQQFDIPLYHLGNSHFHKNIYQTFTRFPGIVVLHDYVLHHFMAEQPTWGNISRYQRELGYNEGIKGTANGWQTYLKKTQPDLFTRPLNARVLDLSLGLIAHSQFVVTKVKEQKPNLPATQVPQIMPRQSGQPKRDKLPFPEDGIIFASIGLMTPSKQIEFALRAFAQLRATTPNAYYLFVGEIMPDVHFEQLLAELKLQNHVFHAGYVENLQDFVDWIVTADVIINLRHPTVGETSATALRAMAAGKPVIVFDHGWYTELPNQASNKIPVMDDAALLTAMQQLANSAAYRQDIGAQALQYTETVCHPQQVAQNYVDFIKMILQKYGGF